MPSKKKRSITVALLTCAAIVAAVAAALASARKPEPPPPRVVAKPKPPARPTPPVPSRPAPVVNKHASNTPPPPKDPPKPAVKRVRPKVDVVFALDTTGSMSGLIRGAKRKIWSIANKILSGQPRPHVRMGLIGYRDLGDAYVTRRYALSEDVDEIHRHLKRFRAGGGGDTPEHVNRALSDAIYRMRWRKGQNVLRLIFLVGDAPPHEGRQGLYSSRLARVAKRRGIVINAVRCGRMASTGLVWARIASLSGGLYASIRQDGGMYAIRTPHDGRLAALNRKLSRTLIIAGGSGVRRRATARARSNAALGAFGAAESATYRARSGRLDSKDLLTQLKRGRKLSSFKKNELPAKVAAMPPAAQAAYVGKVRARRRALRRQILRLATKRDAYIKARRKKRKTKGFDDKIGDALKAQGKRAGLAY